MKPYDSESARLLSAAMSGDMQARIMCIQQELHQNNGFLSGITLSWLMDMANSGDPFARRVYIGVALRGAVPDCDWMKLECWIQDIMKDDVQEGCFLMGNLYNPALPGHSDWKICEKYLRMGVEAGSASCCVMLASAYWEFHRDEVELSEIRSLLERALSEQKEAELYLLLADVCLAMEDFDAAIRTLKKCQKEHPNCAESRIVLGDMYMDGQGVRRNADLAVKEYYKAAGQGNALALLKLGVAHYYGHGCRMNRNRAVNFFLRAAEGGEMGVCHYLAVCYRYGDGAEKNTEEMLRWLEKGVAVDEPHCCLMMAGLCILGEEVELNLNRASELLEVARRNAPQDDASFTESLESLSKELISVTLQKEKDDMEPEEDVVEQLRELCIAGDKEGAGKQLLYMVDNYAISPLIRNALWMALEFKATTPEWTAEILDSLRAMAALFPDVALLLGDMYYFGVGARRNAASSLKFYRLAESVFSDQDEEEREDETIVEDVYARIILGIHEKVLKPKDFGINYWIGKAQRLLPSSGRLNFLMGLLYYFGLHVKKDEKKAKLLFNRAGKLGFRKDWKKSVEDCKFCRTSLYAEVYPEMFDE